MNDANERNKLLEAEINKLAEEMHAISNHETSGYEKLFMKMHEKVYAYANAVYLKKDVYNFRIKEDNKNNKGSYKGYNAEDVIDDTNFPLTVFETIKACLKNFDPEIMPFSHYFNRAFKRALDRNLGIAQSNNVSRTIVKELKEERERILKLGISDDKTVKSLLYDFAMEKNLDINQVNVYINGLVRIYQELDEEGEEPIANTIADKSEASSSKPGKAIVEAERLEELIEKMEEAYKALPVKKLPVISLVLTSSIIEEIYDGERLELFRGRAFFNETVFEKYKETGEVFSQKEIAQMMGVLPSSVSTYYKQFRELLAELLQE